MAMTVLPLTAGREDGRFDLFKALLAALEGNGAALEDRDVLIISTKYVSNSQGRIIDLGAVIPSERGRDVAASFGMRPEMAEIVVRESDRIFGGIGGFVITSAGGIMAPNAGIDRSSAGTGRAVLYPADPYRTAEEMRRKIYLKFAAHVGVILADSRLMPARVGTVGVAIACAGIDPVLDMRARDDLDGNPLKVTFQAVADSLATAANHQMGEGSESRPFAIVRGSGAALTGRTVGPSEMAVPAGQCVYVRGLAGAVPDRRVRALG